MTVVSTQHLPTIPYLGCGLGYRRELAPWIIEAADRVDVVEIVTEQFLQDLGGLEELVDQFPVIPHGVGLSIGTAGPLDRDYLRKVREVSEVTGAPYYSEHLAVTRAGGVDIGHLSPVWYTEDVLRIVVDSVHAVQDHLGKPLVLENISYLFEIPHATMSQGEFFHRMVEATGCGLLLDVANVHINSQNHGFDPVAFLDAFPVHAVVQIHLAGGFWNDGIYIDGHSEPVNEPTWQLLDELLARVSVRVSIVEQDANFPDELTPILADVERSRRAITGSAHR